MSLPLETSVEAEYEDGHVHSETKLADASAFEEGRNTFYDILHHLPAEEHGKMVRFSVFWQDRRYDVDWTALPDNARPVRFRHGYSTRSVDGSFIESGWSGVDFGAQWNDENGSNCQDIVELR